MNRLLKLKEEKEIKAQMEAEAKIKREADLERMKIEKMEARWKQNVRVFAKEFYFTETLMNTPKPNAY